MRLAASVRRFATRRVAVRDPARVPLLRVYVCGVGFFLLFAAYSAAQFLQTAINGGQGYICLLTVYSIFAGAALLAPHAIGLVRPRFLIPLAALPYLAMVVANIFPPTGASTVACAVVGFAAAFLWSAQGLYLQQCATLMVALDPALQLTHANTRTNAAFYLVFAASGAASYASASLVMLYVSNAIVVLFTSLTIVGAIGVLLLSCLPEPSDPSPRVLTVPVFIVALHGACTRCRVRRAAAAAASAAASRSGVALLAISTSRSAGGRETPAASLPNGGACAVKAASAGAAGVASGPSSPAGRPADAPLVVVADDGADGDVSARPCAATTAAGAAALGSGGCSVDGGGGGGGGSDDGKPDADGPTHAPAMPAGSPLPSHHHRRTISVLRAGGGTAPDGDGGGGPADADGGTAKPLPAVAPPPTPPHAPTPSVWYMLAFLAVRERRMRLAAPAIFMFGMMMGGFNGVFVGSFVAASVGAQYVGFVGCTYSLVNAGFSFVWGRATQRACFGRRGAFAVATAVHVTFWVACAAWATVFPLYAPEAEKPALRLRLAFLFAAAAWYAVGDAVWYTQLPATLQTFYPDGADAACANAAIRVYTASGFAIQAGVSARLAGAAVPAQMLALASLLLASSACLWYLHARVASVDAPRRPVPPPSVPAGARSRAASGSAPEPEGGAGAPARPASASASASAAPPTAGPEAAAPRGDGGAEALPGVAHGS